MMETQHLRPWRVFPDRREQGRALVRWRRRDDRCGRHNGARGAGGRGKSGGRWDQLPRDRPLLHKAHRRRHAACRRGCHGALPGKLFNLIFYIHAILCGLYGFDGIDFHVCSLNFYFLKVNVRKFVVIQISCQFNERGPESLGNPISMSNKRLSRLGQENNLKKSRTVSAQKTEPALKI